MRSVAGFIKQLIDEMNEDRATGLAAEQAFFFMLSIFPLLILLLSILPYMDIDPQQAVTFIEAMMPGETADAFEEHIFSVITTPSGGLLTFGIIGTIWTASSGMNAFIGAMNEAFNVRETRSFIKVRLLSILLTFGMIIAIVGSLILLIFGNVIISQISVNLQLPVETERLVNILRWLASLLIMMTILSTLYYVAPDKWFPFKEVIPGAVAATVSWQLISLCFSFYVSNFGNYSATYGSLGGVIVLMFWFFLTGLSLVFGGEINALLRERRDSPKRREE
ncbi:YihY/virulence factor BrkB family protein [Alteribacillus sp. HJP-4]|uniref:YihY/virulence factor BrkB family protein n=1 Tax=Alteribacillus sp. HJP-4 TaxID=2775394 RepID=UPI0035CD16A9